MAKAAPALSVPELEIGYTEILSQGPTRGSDVLNSVRLHKGVTWIALDCVAESGAPMVDVVVDTVATFSTDCRSGEISYYAHELNLAAKREAHLSIEAPDTVRWTVSVQVPKPGGA
ncbi:hypothetical protein ACFYZ5_39745 [Streptomyces chartreusis]|uniref:hypothetical protein n=1 Tax=Streptomyces chartreusis TaxID=1969 RepID=UPI003684B720